MARHKRKAARSNPRRKRMKRSNPIRRRRRMNPRRVKARSNPARRRRRNPVGVGTAGATIRAAKKRAASSWDGGAHDAGVHQPTRSQRRRGKAKKKASSVKKRRSVKRSVKARRPKGATRIRTRIKVVTRYLKRGAAKGKRRRTSFKRALNRARLDALRLQYRVSRMKKGKRKTAYAKRMRRHRLHRVNFSMAGLWASLKAKAPQVGVAAVSVVGMWMIGDKLRPHIETALTKIAGAETAAKYGKWVMPVSVGVVSAGVFAALAMSKSAKMRELAAPALMGGMAAAALLTVKAAGKAAWVPGLGEYVSMGDYVAMSGATLDVDGAQLRLNGMGEYVGMSGGIFGHNQTGSLGALPAPIDPQLNEGREGMRGTEGEPRILEFVDGGSLSGDIFS